MESTYKYYPVTTNTVRAEQDMVNDLADPFNRKGRAQRQRKMDKRNRREARAEMRSF